MCKQELAELIAELQSAHDAMGPDSEFDIGVSEVDDNCYDVDAVVNRMDLCEGSRDNAGNPYPAELMLHLRDGIKIDYSTMDSEDESI